MTTIEHTRVTYLCNFCSMGITTKQRFIFIYGGIIQEEKGGGLFAGNDGTKDFHFHEHCFVESQSSQLSTIFKS